MGLTIDRVRAWEALDSRGTPTVACCVRLDGGAEGLVHVPSGASTGRHEAHERRDHGGRFGGRGVLLAVAAVNDAIAPLLQGRDTTEQQAIDADLESLDGTAALERLGANAVLAASIGCALAAAAAGGMPLWRLLAPDQPPLLPLPMVNVLSGGAHAGGAVDVQDVLVVPVGAGSFTEAIEIAAAVRAAAAAVLREGGHDVALVADEGGLAARLDSNRAAIETVALAIERSGLRPGVDAALALDVAATQLVTHGGYALRAEQRTLTAEELLAEVAGWVRDYPLVSVEDPLGEDDPRWDVATRALRGIQVLGDDLFATSVERLEAGIASGHANAVLVKPNQCGTLSRARAAVARAHAAGYATVVSARSGDTEDTWLADLAVGWRAGQIKVGSTMRSERTAKWNRLLRIEAEEPDAIFAGRAALSPWRTAPAPA